MENERAAEIRESMARHWLSAETSIRAYVAAAIRAPADREDVVQQVALTVARRFEEYDEQRPFLAWALWLAKSRIIDFYRAQGRQKEILSDEILDQIAERFVDRQTETSPKMRALEICLEKLPKRSRSLIQLRYHDGFPIEKIAQSVRSTPGAVRVTLHRIRNMLAECVKQRLLSESNR
jgi:RNA polymerase sigma-70 factor (ECF subfamily)